MKIQIKGNRVSMKAETKQDGHALTALVSELAHNTNEPPPREPRQLPKFINLYKEDAIPQPRCQHGCRYTFPYFRVKMPKHIKFVSYDKDNKRINIEEVYPWGTSMGLDDVCGQVIVNLETIFVVHSEHERETLSIVVIKVEEVKRTIYWSIVFEYDIPF